MKKIRMTKIVTKFKIIRHTNPPTSKPPMVPCDVIEATATRDNIDKSSFGKNCPLRLD